MITDQTVEACRCLSSIWNWKKLSWLAIQSPSLLLFLTKVSRKLMCQRHFSLIFFYDHNKSNMADNDKLSDAKRRELDAYYAKTQSKLSACPQCQTNKDVIPSIRGKPTHELMLYANEGHVKLSGCTEGYGGWCKNCEKFLWVFASSNKRKEKSNVSKEENESIRQTMQSLQAILSQVIFSLLAFDWLLRLSKKSRCRKSASSHPTLFLMSFQAKSINTHSLSVQILRLLDQWPLLTENFFFGEVNSGCLSVWLIFHSMNREWFAFFLRVRID